MILGLLGMTAKASVFCAENQIFFLPYSRFPTFAAHMVAFFATDVTNT